MWSKSQFKITSRCPASKILYGVQPPLTKSQILPTSGRPKWPMVTDKMRKTNYIQEPALYLQYKIHNSHIQGQGQEMTGWSGGYSLGHAMSQGSSHRPHYRMKQMSMNSHTNLLIYPPLSSFTASELTCTHFMGLKIICL